jgi:D-alanyl-lipoteichoic acid acyltransferase DltB (MBOAT superfamily)
LHLTLPLAISFFTFQQIAYLVDSHKGLTKEYDFLNYANFVIFFPQLIAGPIVHHTEMMPQFAQKRNKVKDDRNIALGLFIFSIGLFKKVVIADTFALWATQGFDVAKHLNLLEAWITSLSYTFQIYFDFSGYTDMAIGAALLFNIKLPINFNSPYKALSIRDFWRRWHITLSRFLRDYIYIPLGGSRKSIPRTYYNILFTFLIGGIWHGAGWTFIFWGFLHGVAVTIQRIWHQTGFRFHPVMAWFLTFNFINITWIFFRAHTWQDAIKVLHSMFDLTHIQLPLFLSASLSFLQSYSITFGAWLENIQGKTATPLWIIGAFAIVLLFRNSTEKLRKNQIDLSLFSLLFAACLAAAALVKMLHTPYTEFIYFNF